MIEFVAEIIVYFVFDILASILFKFILSPIGQFLNIPKIDDFMGKLAGILAVLIFLGIVLFWISIIVSMKK